MCGLTELPGPNIPLPCGYQAIAEHFAEGLDIRFGWRVERVHYDVSGMRVVCEGGAELRADAVVVTVSLGVLKVCSAFLESLYVQICPQQGQHQRHCVSAALACVLCHGRPSPHLFGLA